MKSAFYAILLLTIIVACNQSEKQASAQDTTHQPGKKMMEDNVQRIKLIKALDEIRMRIISGDKMQVASVFTFPISTASFALYTEDSLLNARIESDNGNVSKTLFLGYYDKISESFQVDEVKELFRQLDINELNGQNIVKKELIQQSKPCYPFYAIEIEDNKVKLTMGGSVNRNFDVKSASAEAIEENSSEYCEHVLWWVFKFDGSGLVLTEIYGAG